MNNLVRHHVLAPALTRLYTKVFFLNRTVRFAAISAKSAVTMTFERYHLAVWSTYIHMQRFLKNDLLSKCTIIHTEIL